MNNSSLHILDGTFHLQYLSIDRRKLLAHSHDLFLLGPHKTDIGCKGIIHPLYRSVQFFVELLVHQRMQTLTKLLHLLVKIAFGAGPAGRKDKEAKDNGERSCRDPRYVEEGKTNGRRRYRPDCSQGQAAGSHQQRLHHRRLQILRKFLRLLFRIIGVYELAGLFKYRAQKRLPVIVKLPVDRPDHLFIAHAALLTPPVQVLHDVLTQLLLLVCQPIDQISYGSIDTCRAVAHYRILKLLAYLIGLYQIQCALEANRVIKKAISSLTHLQHNVFDFTKSMREVLRHFTAKLLQIVFNSLHRMLVFTEEARSLFYRALRLRDHALHYPQLTEELQARPLSFVQFMEEVVL